MIPAIPAVLVIFWIIRALAHRSRTGQTAPGSRPDQSVFTAMHQPLQGAFWWYALLTIGGLVLLAAQRMHPALRLAALAALVVGWFPWTSARLVARTGWIGGARGLGRLALMAMQLDRDGGALLAAALALCARRHPEAAAAQLAERSRKLRPPLRGAGIAARGLIAAARGHLDEARELLRSVEHLPAEITPGPARQVAASWLAADAAARGDWAELARLETVRAPRDARFLAGCARQLLGTRDAPSPAQLRWWWLVAPRRTFTRGLLSRALAEAPPRPVPLHDRAPAGASRLARAAALHAAALASHPLRAAELTRVGRAWSEAFADPATEQALLRRELELGADGKSDALARLQRRVRGELAWLLRESGESLKAAGVPALQEAVAAVRDELLADLEAQAEAIHQRGEAGRPLPVVEEWHAITRLRLSYARAVGRLPAADRRIAYAAVQPALCSMAVHLFNDRKQRSVAHATFAFLLAEARAVGDAPLVALHEKNVRCGR